MCRFISPFHFITIVSIVKSMNNRKSIHKMELSAQLEQKLTCKVELMYTFFFERASNQLDGHI